MVEAKKIYGENEDKPHRTLLVKAEKKYGGKSRPHRALMAKVESLMKTQ
jgi:hypothetical protein